MMFLIGFASLMLLVLGGFRAAHAYPYAQGTNRAMMAMLGWVGVMLLGFVGVVTAAVGVFG